MTTYELWRERENGAVWAVQFREGAVVGCSGPLDLLDRGTRDLSGLDYSPERAEWTDQHRDGFDLVDSIVA